VLAKFIWDLNDAKREDVGRLAVGFFIFDNIETIDLLMSDVALLGKFDIFFRLLVKSGLWEFWSSMPVVYAEAD